MAISERDKHRHLEATLRGRIVSGEYGPRQRLPNRSAMVAEYSVAVATVQKALDLLMQDGFVESRRGAGTFVVTRPPHLTNIAMVAVAQNPPSLFYRALHDASSAVADESDGGLNFIDYRIPLRIGGDERESRRLCDDAANHRVGGIIFAAPPFGIESSPAMLEPDIPRVSIGSRMSPKMPAVVPDIAGFVRRSLAHLHSRGRRRVAHLRFDTQAFSPGQFNDLVRECGFEARPYWVQSVGSITTASGGDVVHLLMELEGDKRPDALVIHDDNLTEHAIAGLLASGVKVGEELVVVAHTNFPLVTPSPLPMTRMGFDCRDLVRRCVRLIESQRDGVPGPVAEEWVQPVMEDELVSKG